MDSRPFFEFDLREFDERNVDEIKKFAKQSFDMEDVLSTASDLKYRRGIKRVLSEEWTNPSEEFVRILASRVYSGRFTQTVREQFVTIVRTAFHEFVNDRVNDRLQSALRRSTSDEAASEGAAADSENSADPKGVITTEEELEGFRIVCAIVARVTSPDRVFIRDTQSYCGILLDDNNRKPICRLHFDGAKKYLGVLDETKKETRHLVESPRDIYGFAEQLIATCLKYDPDLAASKQG